MSKHHIFIERANEILKQITPGNCIYYFKKFLARRELMDELYKDIYDDFDLIDRFETAHYPNEKEDILKQYRQLPQIEKEALIKGCEVAIRMVEIEDAQSSSLKSQWEVYNLLLQNK